MQLFPALPEVVRGIFRRPEALAVCPPGGEPRERGIFLNQTANYGLSQWEATDRILMEDFNSDNTKTDAALKENADDIAAVKTQLDANGAAHAGFGNCDIYITSYVGNGAASKTLTFNGDPKFIFISAYNGWLSITAGALAGKGLNGLDPTTPSLTWGNKSVTYQAQLPQEACNLSGVTYSVMALIGKASS